MQKPRNEKGRYIKTENPKTERMRLTMEEKQMVLRFREYNKSDSPSQLIKEAYQESKQFGIITIPDVWNKVQSKMSRNEFESLLWSLFDDRIVDLEVHYSPTEEERKAGIPSRYEHPTMKNNYPTYYFMNWRN